jgi:hypothetical protein
MFFVDDFPFNPCRVDGGVIMYNPHIACMVIDIQLLRSL